MGFLSITSYNDLQDAITKIGSANKTLEISTSVTLTQNTVIPSNISLHPISPGIINANGYTLTINGPVVGNPMHQWLSGFAGGGDLKLGDNCKFAFVEWTGAKGDGNTSDTLAFQVLLDAFRLGGALTGNVLLASKIYRVANLSVAQNGLWIIGQNMESTVLKYNGSANGDLLTFAGAYGGLRNLCLHGNSSDPYTDSGAKRALYIKGYPQVTPFTKYCMFENIYIRQSQRGIQMGDYANDTIDPDIALNKFSNILIENGIYGVYQDGQNILQNPFDNLTIAGMTENLIYHSNRGGDTRIKQFGAGSAGNGKAKILNNGGYVSIDGGWSEGGTNNSLLDTITTAIGPCSIQNFTNNNEHNDGTNLWSIRWQGADPVTVENRGGLTVIASEIWGNILVAAAGSPVTTINCAFNTGKGITSIGAGNNAHIIEIGTKLIGTDVDPQFNNVAVSIRGQDRAKLLALEGKIITIRNSSPGAGSGTWAVGDLCFNINPSQGEYVGWQCIIAGSPGTWIPFGQTFLKNTTANRPFLASDAIGYMYMDTTLDADGKPIWWNGSVWIDATGATV